MTVGDGSPRFRRQTVRVEVRTGAIVKKFRNFVAWPEPDPETAFFAFYGTPRLSCAQHTGNSFTQTNGTQCCCQDLFYVSRPRPRPGSSGLETKTETLAIRSRDRDRDLDKMNSSALESRDHGLEITSLAASNQIGDRALV